MPGLLSTQEKGVCVRSVSVYRKIKIISVRVKFRDLTRVSMIQPIE